MGSEESKVSKEKQEERTNELQVATRLKDEATQQRDSYKLEAEKLKQEVDQLKKEQKSTEETVAEILTMTTEMCIKETQQGYKPENIREERDVGQRRTSLEHAASLLPWFDNPKMNNFLQNTSRTQVKQMDINSFQMNTSDSTEKSYYQKKFVNVTSPGTSANIQGAPHGSQNSGGCYPRGRSKSSGRAPRAHENDRFETTMNAKTASKVQNPKKGYQRFEKPVGILPPEANTTVKELNELTEMKTARTDIQASNKSEFKGTHGSRPVNKNRIVPAIGSQTLNLCTKQHSAKSDATSVPPIYLHGNTPLAQIRKILNPFRESSVVINLQNGILVLRANNEILRTALIQAIDSRLPQARIPSPGIEKPHGQFQVVLKGLPKTTDPKEIEIELKNLGYSVVCISQATYKTENSIKKGGTYFITLLKTQKNAGIFNLKSLFYCEVTFEQMKK